MITMWFGSREFLGTTVTDDATTPPTVLTAYDLTIVPFGAPITAAVWVPVVSYAGERGIWADVLPVGTYRVLARVGPGAPNERNIVALDTISVRSR